jgi:DNA-binding MarR family transcriptional regulator
MVGLTPAGRAAVEAAAPGHVAAVRQHFVDRLSPEEVATLGDVFVRVRDGLASCEPSCAVTNETTR